MPISAIDLDGLEVFLTIDGRYLGKWGDKQEIRLVDKDLIENLGYNKVRGLVHQQSIVAAAKSRVITSESLEKMREGGELSTWEHWNLKGMVQSHEWGFTRGQELSDEFTEMYTDAGTEIIREVSPIIVGSLLFRGSGKTSTSGKAGIRKSVGAAPRGFTQNTPQKLIDNYGIKGVKVDKVSRGGQQGLFTEKEGVYIHFFQKNSPYMPQPNPTYIPYVGQSGATNVSLGQRAYDSLQEVLGNRKGSKGTGKHLFYSGQSTFIRLEDTIFKNADDLEFYILSKWGGAGSSTNLNVSRLSPTKDWPSEIPLPKNH